MTRTHSTLINELKVDPKLVADQLGHSLDVNQNVYTIRISLEDRKLWKCWRRLSYEFLIEGF